MKHRFALLASAFALAVLLAPAAAFGAEPMQDSFPGIEAASASHENSSPATPQPTALDNALGGGASEDQPAPAGGSADGEAASGNEDGALADGGSVGGSAGGESVSEAQGGSDSSTEDPASSASVNLGDPGPASDSAHGTVEAAAEDSSPAAASAVPLDVSPAAVDPALAVTPFNRIAGKTAYDTMAAIAQAGWSASEAVVVASGKSYQDALSASALAGMLNAPILLTDPDRLSPQTLSEIKRLKATIAYLIGGRSALSAEVERQIKASGCSTRRISGRTAQDTAVAVSEFMGPERATTAVVVTDAGFQDALSIAPYAYWAHAPIYFSSSKGSRIDAATLASIRQGGFSRVVVAGGKKAVGQAVVDALKQRAQVPSVVRLKGATAEDTSGAVADWCVGQGMSPVHVGVATSAGYQDALAGAALCGRNSSPILLMRDGWRSPIYTFVDPHRAEISPGYVFGGRAAVSPGTYLLLQRQRVRTIPNGVYVLSSQMGKNLMLDLSNASPKDKANIQVYTANNNPAQRFYVGFEDDGFYTIYSVASGKVVEAAGGKMAVGTNVQQYTGNGTDAQKWALFPNADGTYILLNKKSGLAMHLAGGKVEKGTNVRTTTVSTSAKAQQFTFKQVPVLADGIYTFYTKLAQNSKVIDVSGYSVANNTQLQIYADSYPIAQRFVVKHLGDNVYTIQAVVSGKYLADAGSKVVQQQGSASRPAAQKWAISFKNRSIVFTNVATGRSIGVAGNSSKNNAKLKTGAYSGAAGERFRPVKKGNLIADGLYTLGVRAATGQVLDIKSSSFDDGANAQLYRKGAWNAQRFAVIHDGSDYYHIIMSLSGNALSSVKGSGSTANVQTASVGYSTAARYQWKATLTDNGLVFTNKGTGMVLAASGGKTSNGTNVITAKATGSTAQAWLLNPTTINLTDKESLKNLVKNAPTAGKPKLDAAGRNYQVSDGAYKQLMNALAKAYNQGKYVNFIMVETDTGLTYALNADRTSFGASTIKAAYVTYIFQELVEKGKVRYSELEGLMWNTIVWSNNETYATLRNRFGSSGFNSWLSSQGVGWMANTNYPSVSPRQLELAWTKILAYEESGGKYVSKWRSMFNKSDHSFIRAQLSGSNTVYSKPGWMFSGSYGTIHNDAAIVKSKDGRTYLLAVMTNLAPTGSYSVAKGVVAALHRVHNEMPKV